jgi:DNA-binding Lrp family transcriptional regulator
MRVTEYSAIVKRGKGVMKNLELKLVSELFKNSDRSDRELAKVLGVSQPTISRMRNKLKQEGIIKEHTIIADFAKLGMEIMAITFGVWSPARIKEYSDEERVEKAKRFLSDHPNVIYASSGQGLGRGRVMISLHKDYSDYSKFIGQAQAEWAGLVDLESFIISLKGDTIVFPFSFRNLGKYIEK